MQRRRFKPTTTLDERPAEQAKCLRDEAQNVPQGIERERILRRARHAEAASHMQEWLSSPGLQPPK
jgi:hypothetical protein